MVSLRNRFQVLLDDEEEDGRELQTAANECYTGQIVNNN